MNIEKDAIINAIEIDEINTNNISFANIRKIACNFRTQNVWGELDRGRGILKTQEQLNQYWYSYSQMIQAQWQEILNDIDLSNNENIEIIDYGCGQSLASILFFDKWNQKRIVTSKIILIEPSKIALDRAESILQCYLPKAKIISINKTLDNVTQEEVQANDDTVKMHLFSNILDIDDFNIVDLLKKILASKGLHYFLAASHNRDFNGGSKRLKEVYKIFTDEQYSNLFTIKEHVIKEFNAGKFPAICLCILFKV